MTDLCAYWVLKAFLSRMLSLLKLRHGLSFVNWRAKVFMALRTYMLFWPRNNTTLFEKREYSNASKTYRWILVSWRFICSENDEKWHFVSYHSDYLHSKKNSYHLQLPPHFCLHGTDKPISQADKKAIGWCCNKLCIFLNSFYNNRSTFRALADFT